MPPRANWKKLLTSFDFENWLERNSDLVASNYAFPAINEFYTNGQKVSIEVLLNELTAVEEEEPEGYVQQKYPALVKHISSGDVANMRRLSGEMNLMELGATSRSGYVTRFIAAILG
jgi:hypothetical protein